MVVFRGMRLRTPTLQICEEYHRVDARYRGVAQLVARTAGGREVASSSLVIPTMEFI